MNIAPPIPTVSGKLRSMCRSRLSVYSACMPDFTPEQAVASLAGGPYRGIEWRVAPLPDANSGSRPHFRAHNLCTVAPTIAAADRIADLCDRNGLEIVGLAPYVKVGDISAAMHAIDMATIARAPFVRFRAAQSNDESYRVLFDRSLAFFEEIVAYAAPKAIRVLIEMHHGTICSSASLTRRLVEDFLPDELAVIYDVGNLSIEGFEDYSIGLEILGRYVAHVHVKNVRFVPGNRSGRWLPEWSPLDDGIVDLPKFAWNLASTGYRGWISIEDFSTERPTADMLAYNAAYLKSLALVQPASAEHDAC